MDRGFARCYPARHERSLCHNIGRNRQRRAGDRTLARAHLRARPVRAERLGSVRQLPICIGDTKALLLGPLTVEPPFRSRGIGRALLERALKDAKAKEHRLVLLVGDESYYSRVGCRRVPKGRASMPGPVDYDRLLIAELADGAFTDVSGAVRPDWSMAR